MAQTDQARAGLPALRMPLEEAIETQRSIRRLKPDPVETPPDPGRTSSFLNIRVADIQALYAEWSRRGAEFLTPPQDRGAETRCYIRDPDGHLIEVGQTTRTL